MVTVVDQRADQLRDLRLGVYVRLVADGVGEVGLGAVAENCAAVGLSGEALLFQLVQITADGLLRDAVVGCKLADEHALLRAELSENLVFPFNCKHSPIPSDL